MQLFLVAAARTSILDGRQDSNGKRLIALHRKPVTSALSVDPRLKRLCGQRVGFLAFPGG